MQRQAMCTRATLTLAYHGLELRCPAAGLGEDLPLAGNDLACRAQALLERLCLRPDNGPAPAMRTE